MNKMEGRYYQIYPLIKSGKSYIAEIIRENKQLKDNWNKLKEDIDKQLIRENDIDKFAEEHGFLNYNPVRLMIEHFKIKMQELEKGDSNV